MKKPPDPHVPADADIEAHNRTIDHFKAVYAIIAGLALTEACLRVMPLSSAWDFRIPMFFTLFITVVPIFHGGDRSLDVKYRGHIPQNGWERAKLLWDDYMLLLTAILFVCVAEAIPKQPEAGHAAAELNPQAFYYWMAVMLGFDVFVVAVDRIKTPKPERPKKKPYLDWMWMNAALAGLCWWASRITAPSGAALAVIVPLPWGWSFATTLWRVSCGVFVAAVLRTVMDYEFEHGLMLARAGQTPGP